MIFLSRSFLNGTVWTPETAFTIVDFPWATWPLFLKLQANLQKGKIFTMYQILNTNPITYKIKNLNNEKIIGSFYIWGITKIKMLEFNTKINYILINMMEFRIKNIDKLTYGKLSNEKILYYKNKLKCEGLDNFINNIPIKNHIKIQNNTQIKREYN